MAKPERLRELDSIRGIAAIAVLIYHYTARFSDKFDTNIISKHIYFEEGSYGVDIFFTLSGFVIFMSIDKIKTPFEFIYKRFIRLYPTFWICMILTYIITNILGPSEIKAGYIDLIKNITMVPDVLKGKSIDGAYWTLKIEMIFYGLMLIIIILNYKDKIVKLGYGYISIGIILIAISSIYTNNILSSIMTYFNWGLLFLLGINFYKLKSGEITKNNYIQIGSAYLLYSVNGFEKALVGLLIIVLFYLFINNKLKLLSIKPLVFLGKISYALYLLHQNIGYALMLRFMDLGVNNYLLLLLIPTVFSLLLATLVTYLLEKPLLIKLSNLYKVKFEHQ